MILKEIWFDMKKNSREVCCQRLADEKEIGFQDGKWFCYGDGVIQVNDIKYCPFCGKLLPIFKELDNESKT